MLSIFKIRVQNLKRHKGSYVGYFLIPCIILMICVPGTIIKYAIYYSDDDDYYSSYTLSQNEHNFDNLKNYSEDENIKKI